MWQNGYIIHKKEVCINIFSGVPTLIFAKCSQNNYSGGEVSTINICTPFFKEHGMVD